MFKNLISKEAFTGLRFMARLTDYAIFYILLAFTLSCLPYFLSLYFFLSLILLIPVLWIPVEALLVSRYGKTPGGSLFGMKIRTEIGGHLSFSEALRRASFFSPRPGVIFQSKMKFKRKVLAMALSICAVLTAVFGKPLTYYSIGLDPKSSDNGWQQYYSTTRGFAVHFPSNPEQESKKLEIPDAGRVLQYEEISSQQTKDVLYSVSYMELPSKWRIAGSNTLLKGALDLLVKYSPVASNIENRELILYQNHRALDFRLKQGEQDVRGRFILVDNTLYKLTVVYPSSLSQEVQEGTPFLNSFDLHPKGINEKDCQFVK